MSSELQDQAAFEATLIGFFYRQFTKPKPLPGGITLTGKVAAVTGSNTGIGLAACRQLLQLGLSRLVMGVRSQARGDEAAAQLRGEFPAADVSVWAVDMQSYDSVRAFAGRCATLPRIDVAILNAALMKSEYTAEPATGHEVSLQVNYLSTALLAVLLLPVLRSKRAPAAERPPVLSIVGSDLAYRVSVKTRGPVWPQFDVPDGYEQFLWYGRSKLLLTFFFSRLAEFVDPDDVLVNMPNPGTTKGTSFFREIPTLGGFMVAFLQFFFARRVEVGATTYLDAALARGRESHGSFLSDWAFKPYVDPRVLVPFLWLGKPLY